MLNILPQLPQILFTFVKQINLYFAINPTIIILSNKKTSINSFIISIIGDGAYSSVYKVRR